MALGRKNTHWADERPPGAFVMDKRPRRSGRGRELPKPGGVCAAELEVFASRSHEDLGGVVREMLEPAVFAVDDRLRVRRLLARATPIVVIERLTRDSIDRIAHVENDACVTLAARRDREFE